MAKIKLGLTLYSFSSEYINMKLSLEDILKEVSEMGYTGIEIIPAQMCPTYPYVTDEWIEELKSLMKKYNLQPVCWSAYLDMGLATGRDLTEDEIIQYTVNDLIYAKKAGFPIVRSQFSITPEIFVKMIPFCKKLDMKLTIELHHPHFPKHPLWQQYVDICRGVGKGVLGIVPDFGIFINTPHKLWCDQALEMGFEPEKFDKLVDLHKAGVSLEDAQAQLSLNDNEKQIAASMYDEFETRCNPEEIKDIIDVAFYMHGKFYYAEEGQNDPSIPYDEILKAVAETDYDGFIACEYEGHHFTDEIPAAQQLGRYVAMCRRIIGDSIVEA
ncbi:TIM barrel protein [uncultured Eubacterium sp.]|uniref:sugar phosphate isomerase/epimerase family protein n=1 Tax=uncultured Eubacterium sp. TaxID=165185 RepID=UPI0025F36C2F|nr:TIM barrel protein [uncultured Eubacterium sp.]